MAMSKSGLKTRIHDNLVALFGTAKDDAVMNQVCQAIADAVVDEVTANAKVNGGLVTVTGVTAGPSSATGSIANATIT